MIFIFLFLFSSCSYDKPGTNNKAEHVVIITIDGLRPDAISKANAPNLRALIKKGSYTDTAQTVDPPKTLPSHTSLVTGLKPQRHGMYKNKWVPESGYTELDTIFTIVKNQGLGTAMFVGKNKLSYIAVPGTLDRYQVIKNTTTNIDDITGAVATYIKENKPALTLIHYRAPDTAGHKFGWMTEEYLESVEEVDKAIPRLIESLTQTGIYQNTVIIITADHGGFNKNHFGDWPSVSTIPWLAFGKGIKKGYTITEQVNIYDTAPTVLHALGMTPPPDLDGRVIESIFTK